MSREKKEQLTLEDRFEIAEQILNKSTSYRLLAKKYNTSNSTIGRIGKKATFYLEEKEKLKKLPKNRKR
jgi:Trp operon repressor